MQLQEISKTVIKVVRKIFLQTSVHEFQLNAILIFRQRKLHIVGNFIRVHF